MKVRSLISVLLLLTAGLQKVYAQKVVLYKANSQTIEYDVSELDSIVFVEEDVIIDDTHGITNGHEWVDHGLPSGTLWATCNVGADSPEDYGDYFAWGETEPKDYYGWNTYKYCNGSENTLTKYCRHWSYGYNNFTDTLSVLLPDDDAATANWGENWQMPTDEQMTELFHRNNTTTTWTTQNGVEGRLITSKSNNKTLFLPAAGCRTGSILFMGSSGSKGCYWSRSLNYNKSVDALDLSFDEDDVEWDSGWYRETGQSVRPVRKR